MNSREMFGRGLAEIRRSRGMTQAQVAEKAGLAMQFVAALEQGVKAPSFETLDGLCEVLGVQPDELLSKDAAELPHKIYELADSL